MERAARNPGVGCTLEKSRRDDWNLPRRRPGFGEIPGILKSRNNSRPSGSFQSSLRDLSSLEYLPRTAFWAKFSRPSGTHLSQSAGSHTPLKPVPFKKRPRHLSQPLRRQLCPSSHPTTRYLPESWFLRRRDGGVSAGCPRSSGTPESRRCHKDPEIPADPCRPRWKR